MRMPFFCIKKEIREISFNFVRCNIYTDISRESVRVALAYAIVYFIILSPSSLASQKKRHRLVTMDGHKTFLFFSLLLLLFFIFSVFYHNLLALSQFRTLSVSLCSHYSCPSRCGLLVGFRSTRCCAMVMPLFL